MKRISLSLHQYIQASRDLPQAVQHGAGMRLPEATHLQQRHIISLRHASHSSISGSVSDSPQTRYIFNKTNNTKIKKTVELDF